MAPSGPQIHFSWNCALACCLEVISKKSGANLGPRLEFQDLLSFVLVYFTKSTKLFEIPVTALCLESTPR